MKSSCQEVLESTRNFRPNFHQVQVGYTELILFFILSGSSYLAFVNLIKQKGIQIVIYQCCQIL